MDRQYGFKDGSSCEDALFWMTEIIETAFNKKEFVLVISLDISGHLITPGIIHNLMKTNCNPGYIKLIANFLTQRKVQINQNAVATEKMLSMSCPQGDIYSPFLWNIYFNDIFDQNLSDDITAFADDSNLYFVSNDDLNTIEQKANSALSKLHQWSINWSLIAQKLKLSC